MSMFRTGILVLTSPLHTLPLRIAPVLTSAAQFVEQTLYVHLHPGLNLSSILPARPVFVPPSHNLSSLITKLYSRAADVCAHLDVRVLLTNVRNQGLSTNPFPTAQMLSHTPDVVLTDFSVSDSSQVSLVQSCLEKYAMCCYACKPHLQSVLLAPEVEIIGEEKEPQKTELLETYSDVVVGGTFDRLHGAHRTLLTVSCLMTEKRFLIGLSDSALLKNKVLKELIEPYALRMEKLLEFLQDVKPALRYEIVPLSDPYGPSITYPDLQCIVVSEETRKGGQAVNKKRVENGHPELVIYEIKLIKDAHHSDTEEEKISSSSLRSRLLGTLLAPPKKNPNIPLFPYVIGLTGGSGSGKTSIAKRLEALGAAHIDSDRLGHETYNPGGPTYHKVKEVFGNDILNEDGTINRSLLGKKVFGNKEKLKCLTDIVWPEIAKLSTKKILEAASQGKTVCVLDAAVLLEAGWTDMVHEVWVTIIPEGEAIARIMSRDGVSKENAQKRLDNQWTNEQRVERANVVLCTSWEPEVTQRQVQKAWDLLQERIRNQRNGNLS
ncbi:bifunctional coenzyme A synthase [Polypterus senegalus]|uniref:bifunctional coenzyme A synthase n=1 Tax=Polypterus senegalus TaxID=55291 RepID=UPI00196397C7|nr:bifunctional coenzyme A synthase [Polypterus senegalus]